MVALTNQVLAKSSWKIKGPPPQLTCGEHVPYFFQTTYVYVLIIVACKPPDLDGELHQDVYECATNWDRHTWLVRVLPANYQ